MIRKLVLPLVLAFGVQVIVLLLLQPHAEGATSPGHTSGPPWCVNPGGTSGCYARIQDAIDAAPSGTAIDVASGTYTEHIVMKDRVSIYGQGWSSTTIHGGYSGPTPTVYMSSIGASTVLSGVQVTGGGTGVVTTSIQDGGCISIWGGAPVMINTWVQGCTARNGGGVFARWSSPTLDNVPAWLNGVQQRGGGYYLEGTGQVTVTDSSFFSDTNGTVWFNTADWEGGGIFLSGVTATVSGLRIWWNTVSAGNGGGVAIFNASDPISFALNQINGNSAHYGGGVSAYNATQLLFGLNTIDNNNTEYAGAGAQFSDSAGLIQSNWFRANTAGSSGGGLAVTSGSSGLTLRGNWIEGNRAGYGAGVYLQTTAAPWIDGNVIVTNTSNTAAGIALYQAGVATVTNNILARNVASTTAHLAGGILVDSSPARIVNNTIADNTGDGILFQEAEGVAVVNNILSGNLGHGIEHYSDTLWVSPTLLFTADYNDVWNNTDGHYEGPASGPHDLHLDPQFVNAGADLRDFYHILNTSPVSVTGSMAWAPEFDLDGDRRASGGNVSMGADEIVLPIQVTGVSITGPVTGVVNTSYAFSATVSPPEAMQPITYVWQIGGQSVVTHTGQGISDTINLTWNVSGGQVLTVTASNALNAVSDSHEVDVINTYVITPMAGANGSITPGTPQTVSHGASQAFAITPDAGYHIADVCADVVSVGAVSAYTFTNVTANHTITAAFAINTYTLTIATAGNGSGVVTPAVGTHSYDYGTVVTLHATANPGSTFMGWSGAVVTTTNPLMLTMDAVKSVTATFITHQVYLPIVIRP